MKKTSRTLTKAISLKFVATCHRSFWHVRSFYMGGIIFDVSWICTVFAVYGM
jgi:hypothetical protein